MKEISTMHLHHVTGGDQLGDFLTAAVRVGMRDHGTTARSTAGIHWEPALGACFDGMGIVNCPSRRR